jgi:hypothetical protein
MTRLALPKSPLVISLVACARVLLASSMLELNHPVLAVAAAANDELM